MKKSNIIYYKLSDFNSYLTGYKIPLITAKLYRFIIKLFCAIFIFWDKDTRKKARNFYCKKILMSFGIPNTIIMLAKYKNYIKNQKSINTLILGSSHAEYGYRPCNTNEINLAFPSGDLYYSYKLFKIVKNSSPNLKNIILFFSPFSSGFYIQRSSVAVSELTAIMHHLWKIDRFSGGRITNTELNIEKSVKSFTHKNYAHISDAYEDYIIQSEDPATYDQFKSNDQFLQAELQRTKKHLVYAIQDTAMTYLDKLLDEAGSGKINIYIVTPPKTNIHSKIRQA